MIYALINYAKKLGFDNVVFSETDTGTTMQTLILLVKSYMPFKEFPPHVGAISPYYIHSNLMHTSTIIFTAYLRSLGFKAEPNPRTQIKKAANTASIGSYGRNSLIINNDYGSYIHFRAVLTDIKSELLNSKYSLPPIDFISANCTKCQKCIDNCPTGAILDNGRIDKARCLRSLMSGHIPYDRNHAFDLLSKMNNRIMGCDDCQKCCPSNSKLNKMPVDIPGYLLQLLDLYTLLTLEDSEYSMHIAKLAEVLGSNIVRAVRMKINAAIAACNYKGNEFDFKPILKKYLNSRYSGDIHPFYRDYISASIAK